MTRQLTIHQSTKHFNVTERTIRRWIKNGKVNAELVDGKYLISVEMTADDNTPDSDHDNFNDMSPDTSPDSDTSKLLNQVKAENAYLREIITEKDNQINHLQQIVAMSQKNIAQLTEQLDTSKQMIEDMRNRKPFWKRIFSK